MAGYDWSMVSAQQRYYSFGYSFILMPILRLFGSAVIRYRLAVLLQFAGMVLSGFLLYNIYLGENGGKTEEEKGKVAVISGVVMFYAAYMVYAQTTMAESCLTLVFLWIAYVMKGYLENPSLKKALLLCVLSIWLYTVHMRTIGVVCVCFFMILTGIFREDAERRKKVMRSVLVILFFGLLFGGVAFYKENYKQSLTVGEVVYSNVLNDFGGQFGKIKYFFSIKGFWNFMVSLTGKIFYGLSASFGIFFWGMLAAGQSFFRTLKGWKSRKRPTGEQLFYSFLFLAVMAMLLVSAFASIYPGRLDGLIYGRYYEFILPCILYLGVEKMLITKYLKEGTFCWIVFQFLAFFVTRNSIVVNEIREVARHSVIGVGYALYFFGNRVLYIMLAIYMVGCLLGVLTAALIGHIRKTKRYGCLFLIAVLQIVIAGISFVKMIAPANRAFLQSVEMPEEMREELQKENRRAAVYHIYDMKEADKLQFYLKEKSIYVVSKEQEFNDAGLKQTDFIFVDKIYFQETEFTEDEKERLEIEKTEEDRREDLELLSSVYDTVTETANWFIYYNEMP